MKYTLISLLLLLFLTSCKITEIYTFQSLKAPKIILPPDIKTIGFLDRNNHFESDTITQFFLYNEKVEIDSTSYDSIQINNCHIGFNNSLSNIVTNSHIPLIRLKPKKWKGKRNTTPLAWQTVDSICAQNGTDILVCLEDLKIFNQYIIISEETEYEEEIYIASTIVKYNALWRIYDPLQKKYLHEQIINDSLYTYNEAFSKTSLSKQIPSRQSIFADVAFQIGSDYAKSISPKLQKIKRYYFVAGNSDFAIANYYMENNKLQKAMEVWQKIEQNNKGKIAGRAAFNMALGYEILENYKEALHWLRKSTHHYKQLKKRPNEINIVSDYVKELITQTNNNIRLNTFFGKENDLSPNKK